MRPQRARASATSRRCCALLARPRRDASSGAATTRSRLRRRASTATRRRPRRSPSASAPRSCSPGRCSRASASADMPPPGGDVIGRRRLDPHLDAFRALGAPIDARSATSSSPRPRRPARRRGLHGRAVGHGDRERADGRRPHAGHDGDRQRRLRAARAGPRADAREDGRRHPRHRLQRADRRRQARARRLRPHGRRPTTSRSARSWRWPASPAASCASRTPSPTTCG